MRKIILTIFFLFILFLPAYSAKEKCNLKFYEIHTINNLKKGNFQTVIDETSVCISEHPKLANLYSNRANAYKSLNKDELALNDYNKALEIDKTYATAYANRGNLYLKQSKFDKALKDFNAAIILNPKLPTAYTSRAVIKALKGDFDGARADTKKAQELGITPVLINSNYRLIQELYDEAQK